MQWGELNNMLKLKDLLEVIVEGTKVVITDWSEPLHRVIYSKLYELENIVRFEDYKVVSLEQIGNCISINIVKEIKL